MPPAGGAVTLARRGATPLIDVDEETDPFIDFPRQTGVDIRRVEDPIEEWPESDSLVSNAFEILVTPVASAPPRPQFLVMTGSVPLLYISNPVRPVDQLRELSFGVIVPPPGEAGVIGRRLEEARDVLGATTEDIGDAAGVSRASIFAWAKGTTIPRPPTRRGLDRLFGVTGVAAQVFGVQGARDWFAGGSPSRVGRLLSGDVDSVARELDALLSRPPRGQRPARFERDEEPEKLDEGR